MLFSSTHWHNHRPWFYHIAFPWDTRGIGEPLAFVHVTCHWDQGVGSFSILQVDEAHSWLLRCQSFQISGVLFSGSSAPWGTILPSAAQMSPLTSQSHINMNNFGDCSLSIPVNSTARNICSFLPQCLLPLLGHCGQDCNHLHHLHPYQWL